MNLEKDDSTLYYCPVRQCFDENIISEGQQGPIITISLYIFAI